MCCGEGIKNAVYAPHYYHWKTILGAIEKRLVYLLNKEEEKSKKSGKRDATTSHETSEFITVSHKTRPTTPPHF
jgi:hypothetical protein